MATRVQMGSGLGDAYTRETIWRGWQRQANGGRTVVKKASHEELRAFGVNVEIVKRKGPKDGDAAGA